MKYKIIRSAILDYGLINKSYISFNPGQIWELAYKTDHFYAMQRQNVTVQIDKEDFERFFEEVEQ